MEVLRETNKVTVQELGSLRAYLQGNVDSNVMNTDNQRPWVWISETAEKYKAAVEDYSGLRRNFEELSQKYENVVDRCDTKFLKADDSVDLWYNFYFDEAVANTERLHNQIQALKAEKGETHFIESAQPRNPRVADRNVSRCATL
jgi:hypothetical protein